MFASSLRAWYGWKFWLCHAEGWVLNVEHRWQHFNSPLTDEMCSICSNRIFQIRMPLFRYQLLGSISSESISYLSNHLQEFDRTQIWIVIVVFGRWEERELYTGSGGGYVSPQVFSISNALGVGSGAHQRIKRSPFFSSLIHWRLRV